MQNRNVLDSINHPKLQFFAKQCLLFSIWFSWILPLVCQNPLIFYCFLNSSVQQQMQDLSGPLWWKVIVQPQMLLAMQLSTLQTENDLLPSRPACKWILKIRITSIFILHYLLVAWKGKDSFSMQATIDNRYWWSLWLKRNLWWPFEIERIVSCFFMLLAISIEELGKLNNNLYSNLIIVQL